MIATVDRDTLIARIRRAISAGLGEVAAKPGFRPNPAVANNLWRIFGQSQIVVHDIIVPGANYALVLQENPYRIAWGVYVHGGGSVPIMRITSDVASGFQPGVNGANLSFLTFHDLGPLIQRGWEAITGVGVDTRMVFYEIVYFGEDKIW
jgi:hypothetical protein